MPIRTKRALTRRRAEQNRVPAFGHFAAPLVLRKVLIEHSRQTTNLTKTQIIVLLALPTDPIAYRPCLSHVRFPFRRVCNLWSGFG
jgi:hypothetical protein